MGQFLSNLVCRVAYTEGLHKICEFDRNRPSVIEIKNSELAAPVNNTLVHHTAFSSTDTRLYGLI